MLKCPAMIALMLCDFANSWGLYVLVTEGPIFFSEALCFDIQKVTDENIGLVLSAWKDKGYKLLCLCRSASSPACPT